MYFPQTGCFDDTQRHEHRHPKKLQIMRHRLIMKSQKKPKLPYAHEKNYSKIRAIRPIHVQYTRLRYNRVFRRNVVVALRLSNQLLICIYAEVESDQSIITDILEVTLGNLAAVWQKYDLKKRNLRYSWKWYLEFDISYINDYNKHRVVYKRDSKLGVPSKQSSNIPKWPSILPRAN